MEYKDKAGVSEPIKRCLYIHKDSKIDSTVIVRVIEKKSDKKNTNK